MNRQARAIVGLLDTATAPAASAVAGAGTSDHPQARFDDLYSAVYRILDDAKASHQLVKLYKGSHTSPLPHPLVTEAGAHLLLHRHGLFGYTAHRVSTVPHPAGRAAAWWNTYDRLHEPRVSVSEAFRLLESTKRRAGESLTDYAAYVTGRQHDLGHYRGGSTGYDDETRAFLAAHFTGQGIPTHPDEVLIFCGGAKGAFIAACASLMCTRAYDRIHHQGGLVLVPQGYYQSLRLIPAIFGGDITVVDQLTPAAVRDWVAATIGVSGRIVYVPLVNNATGEVLDRHRARGIARAVLTHNQEHLDNPVHVLADDVYVGSYLNTETSSTHAPTPIATVTGAHLGDATLGRMSDWTVTVVSPSKTFALPTCRVAFATTTSSRLRAALAHYRTVFSFGRVPQIDEIMATAALCLTPQHWIDRWNLHHRATSDRLACRLDALNTELGGPVFTLTPPQGGWYMTLHIRADLFPVAVMTTVDAFVVCLHYDPDQHDSGIGLLPGDLFGFGLTPTDTHTLRGTLAVDDPALTEFVRRLRDLALRMRSPDGPETVRRALQRARTIADTTRILRERTF